MEKEKFTNVTFPAGFETVVAKEQNNLICRAGLDVVQLLYERDKKIDPDKKYPHPNFLSTEEENAIETYITEYNGRKLEKKIKKKNEEEKTEKKGKKVEEKKEEEKGKKGKKKETEEEEKEKYSPPTFYYTAKENKKKEKIDEEKKGEVKKGDAKKGDTKKGEAKKGDVKEDKGKAKANEHPKTPLIRLNAQSKIFLTYLLGKAVGEMETFYKIRGKKFPTDSDEQKNLELFVSEIKTERNGEPNIIPFIKAITDKINIPAWIKIEHGNLEGVMTLKLDSYFKGVNRSGFQTFRKHFVNLWVKFIKVLAIFTGIANYEARNIVFIPKILTMLNVFAHPLHFASIHAKNAIEWDKNKKENKKKGKRNGSVKTNIASEIGDDDGEDEDDKKDDESNEDKDDEDDEDDKDDKDDKDKEDDEDDEDKDDEDKDDEEEIVNSKKTPKKEIKGTKVQKKPAQKKAQKDEDESDQEDEEDVKKKAPKTKETDKKKAKVSATSKLGKDSLIKNTKNTDLDFSDDE